MKYQILRGVGNLSREVMNLSRGVVNLSRVVVAIFAAAATTATFAESNTKIAAAANLRYVLTEIERLYEAKNPDEKLQINFGASGAFYQQIINGAPYNLFLSADELLPQRVVEQGLAVGESRVYACGKLALYGLRDDVAEQGLALVSESSVERISIANPRTAPYGTRSVEILKAQGLWSSVERKIVYGDSIAQAAQFATTGNCQLGFVALSLLLNPEVALKGSYFIIPKEMYAPIAQSAVVIKQPSGSEAAAKFLNYLLSEECSEIWNKYGYTLYEWELAPF